MKEEGNRFPTRWKMLWYFLEGSKKFFFISIVFACLVSLIDLINPKIIRYTVDSVLSDKESSLPASVNRWIDCFGGTVFLKQHLGCIALAVAIIALAGALCRFLFQYFNTKGAEKLVQRMRETLFSHLLRLPSSWYSQNHTGDIIQRCTSDVDQVKVFLSEQLTSLFRVIILIVMALYYMNGIHHGMALASGLFIPVIVLYSFFFHNRIGSQFYKVDEEEGKLSSIAQENLTGVRVVRAFGRESYERERFEKQNEKYTGMWVYLMKILSLFWASGDLFSYLQILTVLVYGAVECVHGNLTAGSYIAFISYNGMLTWPVRSLGRVISNLSKAGISIDRIRYIMNAEEEKEPADALTCDMHQDITFDHVSFHYENQQDETLDDVSFTVKAGSTVGILGGTGSGKSTLMMLLDKMYEPESGTIRIGNQDIQGISTSWLRENIGMVLQEPYLFSRTLSENIAITRKKTDLNEVRHAAKLASLDDSVSHFAHGYETYVGERGVTLSGGQKQRTAIAQMLIRKPPVMIFDDSLSAVDAETDARIRHALQENTNGSTVILIAHRLTTLMNADRIYVMDRGRIAEQGTHEELLKKNGIYRRIYDLQTRGSEVPE